MSETEAFGDHQMRAAHQRYTVRDKKSVEAKGRGHGVIRPITKAKWVVETLRAQANPEMGRVQFRRHLR
jgi:scytalone dehydratase